MANKSGEAQSANSNTTVSVVGSPQGGGGQGIVPLSSAMAMAMAMAMGNSHLSGSQDEGDSPYRHFGADLEQRHYADAARLLIAFFTHSGWEKITVEDWRIAAKSQQQGELEMLLKLQGGEAQSLRYNEIINESQDFVGLFEQMAFFDAYSHPKTVRLINFIVEAGYFVVQHFKGKTQRPRPSQVEPAIHPLINVPAFSAYPSGHATQAYLVFKVLHDLMPSTTGHGKLLVQLEETAKRIGKNREYAGVHYPSDTMAGQKLAIELSQLVNKISKTKPSGTEPQKELIELIAAARDEWS